MMCRSWYGSARFSTTSGWKSSIRATSASTLSASTCAVRIFVFVVPSSFSLSASHFDFVREAIMISLNSSEFWQHLWMATLATPPQPMIKAFPMVIPPEVWNDGI